MAELWPDQLGWGHVQVRVQGANRRGGGEPQPGQKEVKDLKGKRFKELAVIRDPRDYSALQPRRQPS
jgi:hypothetical protein